MYVVNFDDIIKWFSEINTVLAVVTVVLFLKSQAV